MGTGTEEAISLEYLLPHSPKARHAVFQEVDAVAMYHYKLKILHEEQVRRRFGSKGHNDITAAEEEAAHELVDSVIGQMSIGDLVQGDAAEMGDDSSEEFTSSEDESSAGDTASRHTGKKSPTTRTPRTSPPSSRPPSQPPSRPSSISGKIKGVFHKRNSSDSSSIQRAATPSSYQPRKKKKGTPRPKEPELKVIPDLLPLFLELVRPSHTLCDQRNSSDVYAPQVRPRLQAKLQAN